MILNEIEMNAGRERNEKRRETMQEGTKKIKQK